MVLVVSILASFVAFLDGSIVNVALPAIARDLGGGLSAQQWVIDAYLLMLGSLILIAGSLSDLFGRKRIIRLGLIGFGVFSLLCAFAPSIGSLVVFRALQGAAGALLVPSSLALIISSFSGQAQAKAIGTWTAWTGISFVIGPLLGGFLVDDASWRWVFAINVLPIVITLVLLRLIAAPKQTSSKTQVDYKGALMCAVGLGATVFALIEQSHYGWGSPGIYLPFIAGLIILASFLFFEKKTAKPMLSLSLFKNHNFSVGNIATFAIYAGLSASTFLIVVFLQQVQGKSALIAGLALLPVTVIMFFISPRTGALASKYGPRLFMGIGPLIGGIGFLLIMRVGAYSHYLSVLFPAVIVFGIGLSITVAPLTAAILSDVHPEQAGVASAVNNAVARIAGLIAVAVVGTIVAGSFAHSLVSNKSLAYVQPGAIKTAKQAPLVVTPPQPYRADKQFESALRTSSVKAFHSGILTIALLLIVGGVISLIGIKNPDKLKTEPV